MDELLWVWDVFLHLDVKLNVLAGQLGPWLYVVLFAIVFCETGLVVTPFLPGDSLLFAVGALSATDGSPIDPLATAALLIAAAVLGDAVNYAIGRKLGPKIFNRPSSWLLNQKHLLRAKLFYEEHGGKAIILARFVPIVRTFAPFVAGIGEMQYRRFALFNVTGAALWVVSLGGAGYLFGGIDWVKKNFSVIVLAIVFISILPVVHEWWRARKRPEKVEVPLPAPAEPPAPT
jgi:membrane-associated protein